MSGHRKLAAVGIVLLMLTFASSSTRSEDDLPINFRATAIAMGVSVPPVVPRGGAPVQIDISRWSTDEEQEALFTALAESGQGKFFDDLERQVETGILRVTGSRAGRVPVVRFRYAREYGYGDTRRIVLATTRPISFYETVRSPRWREYDVSFVVLDVGEDGRGEGQMAVGARLEFDEENGKLAIQSFSSEPVRLNNLRQR